VLDGQKPDFPAGWAVRRKVCRPRVWSWAGTICRALRTTASSQTARGSIPKHEERKMMGAGGCYSGKGLSYRFSLVKFRGIWFEKKPCRRGDLSRQFSCRRAGIDTRGLTIRQVWALGIYRRGQRFWEANRRKRSALKEWGEKLDVHGKCFCGRNWQLVVGGVRASGA